jgi:hypothetical protein
MEIEPGWLNAQTQPIALLLSWFTAEQLNLFLIPGELQQFASAKDISHNQNDKKGLTYFHVRVEELL